MRKTILYSLCGCLVTGTSVAVPIYIDLGENSSCPAKQGMCAINPGPGYCCPANYVVTGINNSSASDSKIFGGVYTDNGMMLFDKDGSPVDPKEFTSEERSAVMESLDKGGGETARLGKQEYNQGTQFWSFDENGDIVVSDQAPAKSGSCDKVMIKFYGCKEYKDRGKTCGHTIPLTECCKSNQIVEYDPVYYKTGDGYFSDSNFTQRITTLNAPTFSGHVFRGYFTTFWGSANTNISSYIAHYPPYRTIGHAIMARTSSGGVELPSANWAAGWGSCGSSGMASMKLYAGWAEECHDPEHCEVRITGSQSPQPADLLENGYVRDTSAGPRKWKFNLKDTPVITGDWLPGAVEYRWKGSCPSGVDSVGYTSISLPYPYGSSNPPITQELKTANLSCYTPADITIKYSNSSGTTTIKHCTDGEDYQIINPFSSTTTYYGFKYKGLTSGNTVFNVGTTVPCSVGTGGFTHYTETDGGYIVELEPVTRVNITYNYANGGTPTYVGCDIGTTHTVPGTTGAKAFYYDKHTPADGTVIAGDHITCKPGNDGFKYTTANNVGNYQVTFAETDVPTVEVTKINFTYRVVIPGAGEGSGEGGLVSHNGTVCSNTGTCTIGGNNTVTFESTVTCPDSTTVNVTQWTAGTNTTYGVNQHPACTIEKFPGGSTSGDTYSVTLIGTQEVNGNYINQVIIK